MSLGQGAPLMGRPIPVPKCPWCEKPASKTLWLQIEVPPKSGLIFQIMYCGHDDCHKVTGWVFMGEKKPLIEAPPGSTIPPNFDPTKLHG